MGTKRDKPEEDAQEEKEAPKFYSEGWQEYVLSMFDSSEMVDGKPKAEGMLRVARNLFGTTVSISTVVHEVCPAYCFVTCEVECVDYRGDSCMIHGSAECTQDNTDEPYNKYPLATAETRAMGRALKRLLGLNILTAEESSKKAELTQISNDENRTEGSITPNQVRVIDKTCKRLNIDLETVIVITDFGEYEDINQVSHATALAIIATLDQWEREKVEWNGLLDTEDKDPPALMSISAYNPDWKSSFYKG